MKFLLKSSPLLAAAASLFLVARSQSAAPPPPSDRARPLFDGATLTGWESPTSDLWKVEDRCLTGGDGARKIPRNDFLCTTRSFQDFVLRLRIKLTGDPKTGMINSGIQIRSQRVPGHTEASGYQCDFGEPAWYAAIYDEGRRNRLLVPSDMKALDPVIKRGDWNDYVIKAEGPRIQTWINGVQGADYTEPDASNVPQDGIIGIQIHGGGAAKVQVKDISIEELPPTPNAPTWEKLGGVEGVRKLISPPIKPNTDDRKRKTQNGKRDIGYNDVQGTPQTAEEQLERFHLPDGFEIELVLKESPGIGKFISVTFDQRGRMWTQTALEYPVDANENPAAAEALYAGKGRDKVLVYPREALNAPLPPGGLTKPAVFADGLAIPLGILPWGAGDSAYILHGHDIKLFKDTNGDGKADEAKLILTGFGVQDSHLFPHQFTRAPGGWIWMAQGLFNNSKVRRPNDSKEVDWAKCSMARMRPDGSEFEVTSLGPNNIWGLAITAGGEAFIQEANDYGYPVMPFHEYAYYPGGMEALRKSYQPEFPVQAGFRLGGTGLSGLALGEGGFRKLTPALKETGLCMFVANPIISKVQTIAMHRAARGDPRAAQDAPNDWRLEQGRDLLTCDDPFFRPVAMTQGPDGCLYIVDWYNKIISHNEVPRNHPDRDKTRGRVWRVKPKAPRTANLEDFTKLGGDELRAMLATPPAARAHMAWQTLTDRGAKFDHWSQSEYRNGAARDEILALGRSLDKAAGPAMAKLLSFAKPSLPGPTAPGRSGRPIPIREAYDRESERCLARMFLERHPDAVARFLDSAEAGTLPIEARVLASLALDPKAGASRVAKLLPRLDRAPNDEELLRLAQFPDEPGCGDALRSLLSNPNSRIAVAERLLAQKTKLDPARIAPLLSDAAEQLLGGDEGERGLGVNLIGGFHLASLEPELVAMTRKADSQSPAAVESRRSLLRALRELRSGATDLFVELVKSGQPALCDEALAALAASRNPNASEEVFALYPSLSSAQRRSALGELSGSKAGARAVVDAVLDKKLSQDDLDSQTAERLATVLGDDPAVARLQQRLGGVFRELLLLDGQDSAWVDGAFTLDGPFTVETWVRLAPGIGNEDGILGAPGGIDLNFFQSKFRVYAGRELRDVAVAAKPVAPDLWTHVAVTRDEQGICRIFQNGDLEATATRPAPMKWEKCRIGWSGPNRGTEGAIAEFRVWHRARTPREIRANFDRVLPASDGCEKPLDRLRGDRAAIGATGSHGALGRGARFARTIDTPPLLTPEQAEALDRRFAKYSALAPRGDTANGKILSAICLACHQIGSVGAQIGPNLSGAGAMGLEGVLRNILSPNAAMESGYRIFRVELTSGDLADALFLSEDKDAYVVRQPGLPDRRIPKKDVRSTRFIRRSLMPEGLIDALADQQAADLLAYLMTLRG